MTSRTVPKRLHVLVGIAVVSAAFLYRPHVRSGERLPYQSHPPLRGIHVPTIRLANGTERSLADGRAHVIYFFATDCAPCNTQRALMVRLLNAVDSQSVIAASIEDSSTIANYWLDVVEADTSAALPQPVSIDSGWLQSTKLPIRPPSLLFITKDGRVSQLITGSLLSWSPISVRKQLVVAQIREAF